MALDLAETSSKATASLKWVGLDLNPLPPRPLLFLSMRTETARAGLPARVAKSCSLFDVGVLCMPEQYKRTCGSSVA